jgi:hypothetical protein
MGNNVNPYEAHGEPHSVEPRSLLYNTLIVYVSAGIVVQVIFYRAALFSLGFGHGTENIANALFPVSNALFGGRFSERAMPLAFLDYVQYIFYFGLVGVASMLGRPVLGFLLVAIVHAVAIVLAQ